MSKKIFLALLGLAFLISCKNDVDGIPEPVGGQLPTNYIFIRDSGFVPKSIQGTRGSTFTFVNQTTSAKGVYSLDSIIIKKPTVDANSSFVFYKDTVGLIYFFMAGNPAKNGTINIIP
jgi:hypothetical protein